MNKVMEKIFDSAFVLAKASKAEPSTSTLTIILFYLMFTILEAGIETLIFGRHFAHWLDPIFAIGFISYAAYVVWVCACIHENKDEGTD